MLRILEIAIGFGVIIMFTVAGILTIRRFSGTARLDSSERQALEDVQARLGELDQVNQRVGELEERLDFAERLLAARHEEQRLGPSQDAS